MRRMTFRPSNLQRSACILIVALLILFSSIRLNEIQGPEWAIVVQAHGDLVLATLNTLITVEEEDLRIESHIVFETKGLAPIMSFTVNGYGTRLAEYTPALIVIDSFYIQHPNGTRRFYVFPSGAIQSVFSPALSDKYDKQSTQAIYLLNLTDLTLNSQRNFLSRVPFKDDIAEAKEIVVRGQIRLAFAMLGGVGKIGKSRFFRMAFHSSANGTFIFFDVTISQVESLRIAKVGDSDMTRVAPNHAWGGFFAAPVEFKAVYVEWESPSPPAPWESHPWDWILSGVVGATAWELLKRGRSLMQKIKKVLIKEGRGDL